MLHLELFLVIVVTLSVLQQSGELWIWIVRIVAISKWLFGICFFCDVPGPCSHDSSVSRVVVTIYIACHWAHGNDRSMYNNFALHFASHWTHFVCTSCFILPTVTHTRGRQAPEHKMNHKVMWAAIISTCTNQDCFDRSYCSYRWPFSHIQSHLHFSLAPMISMFFASPRATNWL